MPFHFCMDEVYALLLALSTLPVLGPWMAAKVRRWRKK